MEYSARLVREKDVHPDGTFGQLTVFQGSYGMSPFYTVEDDWRGNAKSVSCIPKGTYQCKRTVYHKHNYETFEVTGVPGRSRILIHPGNTENDVEGCIAIGLRPGTINVIDEDSPEHLAHAEEFKGKPCPCPLVPHRAVVNSQPAFRRFMDTMAHVDEFELEIV